MYAEIKTDNYGLISDVLAKAADRNRNANVTLGKSGDVYRIEICDEQEPAT